MGRCRAGAELTDELANRLVVSPVLNGMRLHRYLPAFLVVLALLLFVTACGGKGGGY